MSRRGRAVLVKDQGEPYWALVLILLLNGVCIVCSCIPISGLKSQTTKYDSYISSYILLCIYIFM